MVKRVTLNDIAAHAGVSRSAVSLTVRGDGRLAQQTRERILRSMDELGYVYNRSAAALREKNRRLVGVVLSTLDNPFYTQSLQAIEVELARLDYGVITASSLRSTMREQEVLRSMREFGVTGVIFASVGDAVADTSAQLEAAGVACLSYTRYDPAVDYVGPNDVEGGRLAAEHLLTHGAKTLAFVGGQRPSSVSHMRQSGIRSVLDEAGIRTPLISTTCEASMRGGYEAGHALLEAGPLPDAIICLSDAIAFGFIRALREAGLSTLPRIVGFDDVELASYCDPSLTTVSSHPDRMGRLAARLLVQRLEGQRPAPQVHYTEPDLVVRESCGCGRTRGAAAHL
ncbi:MAG: LacI family DNA-binding transcriptional regulator [Propioniciclava sp.]|uniref:LacI family DNA-binding transcriptional regulator n=1 Tax=Propioniciclava sp. TaxID=2038686 RepID=UPI0039E6317D